MIAWQLQLDSLSNSHNVAKPKGRGNFPSLIFLFDKILGKILGSSLNTVFSWYITVGMILLAFKETRPKVSVRRWKGEHIFFMNFSLVIWKLLA